MPRHRTSRGSAGGDLSVGLEFGQAGIICRVGPISCVARLRGSLVQCGASPYGCGGRHQRTAPRTGAALAAQPARSRSRFPSTVTSCSSSRGGGTKLHLDALPSRLALCHARTARFQIERPHPWWHTVISYSHQSGVKSSGFAVARRGCMRSGLKTLRSSGSRKAFLVSCKEKVDDRHGAKKVLAIPCRGAVACREWRAWWSVGYAICLDHESCAVRRRPALRAPA